jgi:hypothetical protein
MKNVLFGFGIFALLLFTMSFKNVINQSGPDMRVRTQVPLKQKYVFVTKDINVANRYIRKGYQLQDVDVVLDDRIRTTYKYYTLIKY